MIRRNIPLISFDSLFENKHPFLEHYRYEKIALQNVLFTNITDMMRKISSCETSFKQKSKNIKEFLEFFRNEFPFCDDFVFDEDPDCLGIWILQGTYFQYQDLWVEDNHYSLHYIRKYNKFFWELTEEECLEYLTNCSENNNLISIDLKRQIAMVQYKHQSFVSFESSSYKAGGMPIKFYKNGKVIISKR